MKKERRLYVSHAFDNANLFEDYLKLLKKHKFVHAKYEYIIKGDMSCEEMSDVLNEIDEVNPRFCRYYGNNSRHLFINELSFLQEACHLRDANKILKEFNPNLEIIRDIKLFTDETFEESARQHIKDKLGVEISDKSTEDWHEMQYLVQGLTGTIYDNFMFALNSYEWLELDAEMFVDTARMTFEIAQKTESEEFFDDEYSQDFDNESYEDPSLLLASLITR